jgi:hypothetical protein
MRDAAQGSDRNDVHATGLRRPRLAIEIAAALAIKLVLLFAIWAAWFSHPLRPNLDERSVAAAVLGAGHGATERREAQE